MFGNFSKKLLADCNLGRAGRIKDQASYSKDLGTYFSQARWANLIENNFVKSTAVSSIHFATNLILVYATNKNCITRRREDVPINSIDQKQSVPYDFYSKFLKIWKSYLTLKIRKNIKTFKCIHFYVNQQCLTSLVFKLSNPLIWQEAWAK
jgi:hypothetical protein